ncbi:chitin synthase chs-2-like [Mercenaria mercenaria]|uniref:chitin synthase chs-2-like n=1 Tax=Mercenaria mercenaria TaxID=6596 RepID=UPI00234F90A7|nr:chitin synthase chs-2-like [Mercenaria mercenaria]
MKGRTESAGDFLQQMFLDVYQVFHCDKPSFSHFTCAIVFVLVFYGLIRLCLCNCQIQSGWRIEYCAASENKTHCPEDFDEFFKQRRRWIASTLANLWLLIKEWRYIRKHNLRVSYLFLVYQVLLLVATLISPSSIILVVSGGLKYGMNFNPEATFSLQLVLCLCFTLICLYTSQRVQLYK